MTDDLDQQIRKHLDRYEEFRNRDGHDLADALRAVLDLTRRDQRFIRANIPATQWMVGYDNALDEVRKAIAHGLGITTEPVDECGSHDRPADSGDALCHATSPSTRPPSRFACTLPAGHGPDHVATGVGGAVLKTWSDPWSPIVFAPGTPDKAVQLNAAIAAAEDAGYACLLTEETDSEAFAALPDCEHCEGSGKNLAGSPWETPGVSDV